MSGGPEFSPVDGTGRGEEELFDAARNLAGEGERGAFLERACGGDGALRRRIEALLSAEQEAEQFFTASGTAVKAHGILLPGAAAAGARVDLPGEEPIGARIGRYKLVEKLGEGGCGVVYLAEQEEPVRRRVALKIIKLGMETKSVIARFEAERQALAMMDHPNIARVYDAGATDRGPPYFVMEVVRGVKITDYCDQHRLGISERLDLFVQICHAIQHAHQKGIIHGDIKPSNVMVAGQDGVAVPKVIDFGISKATEARLTDRHLFTTYAQLIGTPAYMSPEQAEMGGVDIDTRSDIYSLGVLLYELLTGRTPFEAKELLDAGLDQMRQTLREREPLRPSARWHAPGGEALEKMAELRGGEPAKMVSRLRGDLDWIVMKALEKDRRRRYETANGLALDVQRHLNNEPVAARPPSWAYRTQKLVRRNRVVVTAGAAVVAALVAGMGTSTWLFFKEREARHRAVAAEKQQEGLRHEAELREKITQAALLVSLERFEEADALLADIAVSKPTVEGAAVFRSVGEWHAIHGRWQAAAQRFSRLLQINSLDGADACTLDCLKQGPALVELGDAAAFERFRQETIARFTGKPCPFPDRIVKISVLLPADEKTVASLAAWAELTEKSMAEAEGAGEVFQAAWRAMSLALLEYRRGNFAHAIELSRRCVAFPEYNAPRVATAQLILAMSHQRLGQPGEARGELGAAREVFESKAKPRDERGTPMQGFWFDWIFARILQREATSLIEAPTGSR